MGCQTRCNVLKEIKRGLQKETRQRELRKLKGRISNEFTETLQTLFNTTQPYTIPSKCSLHYNQPFVSQCLRNIRENVHLSLREYLIKAAPSPTRHFRRSLRYVDPKETSSRPRGYTQGYPRGYPYDTPTTLQRVPNETPKDNP